MREWVIDPFPQPLSYRKEIMKIKLGGVSVNGNFEVMPEGVYVVQLTDYGMKTAASGNEYMNCEFTIIDGEYEGRKLWDKIVFTPTALWKLKALALAIGYPNVDAEDGVETEDVFNEALNVPVKVKVIVDTFTGKSGTKQTNNKIEGYIFEDSNTPNVLPTEEDPFK